MGPKMRVVIASSGSRLPTDATDVGLFPSVYLQRGSFLLQFPYTMSYLQMVGQIVTPWELLMAVLAFVIPVTRKTCTSIRSILGRKLWSSTYHWVYWSHGKSHTLVAQHFLGHRTQGTHFLMENKEIRHEERTDIKKRFKAWSKRKEKKWKHSSHV